MASDFNGQKVIVCGGSSGVGLASAKAFTAAGAHVTATGRSIERLNTALAGIDGATGAELDGGDEAAVMRFFQEHGPVDHVVVSIGGGAAAGTFDAIDGAAWQRAFDGKLLPYLYAARGAAAVLSKSGSLTLVTGAAALRPQASGTGRALVNAALNAVVGPLSMELAPARVNAVAPGLLATPYWDAFMDESAKQAMYDKAAARLPAGRPGTGEDIAEAVLFLAGNGFTTGSIIVSDGGPPLS